MEVKSSWFSWSCADTGASRGSALPTGEVGRPELAPTPSLSPSSVAAETRAGIRTAANLKLTWDIIFNQGKAEMNTKSLFFSMQVCISAFGLGLSGLGRAGPGEGLAPRTEGAVSLLPSTGCSEERAGPCPTPASGMGALRPLRLTWPPKTAACLPPVRPKPPFKGPL